MITAFLTWLEHRDWDEGASLMVFGALIGLAAGLGVVGFYRLIDLAHFALIRLPQNKLPSVGQALYLRFSRALACGAPGFSSVGRGSPMVRACRTFSSLLQNVMVRFLYTPSRFGRSRPRSPS